MLPWQCYVQEAFGGKDAKNEHKIMVFAPCCPKSSPISTFGVCNMNQHPILSLFTKFELNWLRNKKVMKKPHFQWNKWQN